MGVSGRPWFEEYKDVWGHLGMGTVDFNEMDRYRLGWHSEDELIKYPNTARTAVSDKTFVVYPVDRSESKGHQMLMLMDMPTKDQAFTCSWRQWSGLPKTVVSGRRGPGVKYDENAWFGLSKGSSTGSIQDNMYNLQGFTCLYVTGGQSQLKRRDWRIDMNVMDADWPFALPRRGPTGPTVPTGPNVPAA